MKICITCEGISETEDSRCVHCSTPLLDTRDVHFPLRKGEADAAHPLIGKVIGGKYRVLSVLGKGGMGTVFRAVHEVSLVPVALKLMNPRFAARQDFRSWFLAARSAIKPAGEITCSSSRATAPGHPANTGGRSCGRS